MRDMAVAYSRASTGIHAPLVSVEVHLTRGLPRMTMVGLPATAVKESKDRVQSAIINSGFDFPLRKITINLAPADLPKQGGRFDLPIALGILAASKQLSAEYLKNFECIGELALSGEIRPATGVLSFVIGAKLEKKHCIIPMLCANDAHYAKHEHCYGASHLSEVVGHIQKIHTLTKIIPQNQAMPTIKRPDMADVQGQPQARRALEIAASGGHNLLMIGPPGVGKSMLASRLPSIIPPIEPDQSLTIGQIHSLHQHGLSPEHWQHPPFRSPHHSISTAALIGGGNPPTPGEISLAHHGILFLDEFNEFQRSAKEALREPLETGVIHISRAKHSSAFPANFQLIAAINPCPCGYFNDSSGRCHCTSEQIRKHHAKISGPLLDRIDIKIRLHRINHQLLIQPKSQEKSAVIRERTTMARQRQIKRQQMTNASLGSAELKAHLNLSQAATKYWLKVSQENASPRALIKWLKIARTIADLENSSTTECNHLIEAKILQEP